MTIPARTRPKRKDDPENLEAWKAEARYGRARTIGLSIVCSGLVSLFIGNAFETSNFNELVGRARSNCEGTQQVARTLESVASDIVVNTEDPEIKARWDGYAREFGRGFPPGQGSCAETFKKRSYIPFVD